jgi:hypothetical protein
MAAGNGFSLSESAPFAPMPSRAPGPRTIRRLLDEHARSVRSWHEQPWNLLMLELWHRFIDQRPAIPRCGDRTFPPAYADMQVS